MILTEPSRSINKVTNLAEVREAREKSKMAGSSTTDADGHGNRRFDAEKVARIKAAIAAGEYEIDPGRIADKFIEHDRNQ